jgi:hypothetical protein
LGQQFLLQRGSGLFHDGKFFGAAIADARLNPENCTRCRTWLRGRPSQDPGSETASWVFSQILAAASNFARIFGWPGASIQMDKSHGQSLGV